VPSLQPIREKIYQEKIYQEKIYQEKIYQEKIYQEKIYQEKIFLFLTISPHTSYDLPVMNFL